MPWLRFRFRGRQKVYAHVDAAGTLVVEGGRVRIRYKLEDPREYTARPDNLERIPEAEIQHGEVPDAVVPGEAAGEGAEGDEAAAASRVKVIETPAVIPTAPDEGVVLIFTDGACTGNPGPAGLGVLLMFGPHRMELWEYLGTGTNNIAELTAILRALEAVRDPRRPVQLYTDSSYSIGVLARGWKAKANPELIAQIRDKLETFSDLTLIKVKGHAGHPLNELVDALARRAIAEQGSGEQRSSAALDVPVQGVAGVVAAASAAATAAPPARVLAGKGGLKVVERPERIPDSPPDGVILAFTDGACFGNPGPAGLGVVIADGEEVRELSEYLGKGTNNIAELTAILRTLEAVEDRARPLHVYTDSSYAIGVLARGWKAKANPELIARIRALLGQFADVTLHKVKGHAGHALNERVDQLAKRAIENRQG